MRCEITLFGHLKTCNCCLYLRETGLATGAWPGPPGALHGIAVTTETTYSSTGRSRLKTNDHHTAEHADHSPTHPLLAATS